MFKFQVSNTTSTQQRIIHYESISSSNSTIVIISLKIALAVSSRIIQSGLFALMINLIMINIAHLVH